MHWGRIILVGIIAGIVFAVTFIFITPASSPAEFAHNAAYRALCIVASSILMYFITRPKKPKKSKSKAKTNKRKEK